MTAGYGNRGFEPFIQLMKLYQVTHLVDVRRVPKSSYWQDFRRERLMDIVPPTGIKYVYMGDTLGGVQDNPVLCDPQSEEPLFRETKLELGLDRLVRAASVTGRQICLMCGCLRPNDCHRSRLLGVALRKRGLEVMHINDIGQLTPQTEIEEAGRQLQLALF